MKPIHAVLLFLASFCVQQGTSNGTLRAQESFGNFAWQKGQTFRYQVEHKTTASDKQGATTSEVKTELNLLKEWKVLAVDPDGTAQIQLKLLALRSVTKKPDGELFTFDSAKPESSTPQLRDQMSKFVGDPVALLIVDKTGKVNEVRENRFGSPKRFDTDPPMALIFGKGPIILGTKWERPVTIAADPTVAPSESNGWQALVKSECIAATSTTRTIKTEGVWTKEPQASEAKIGLLQYFPKTEIVLDQAGMPPKLIVSKMDRTIKHGDKESNVYRLISEYRESRIDE